MSLRDKLITTKGDTMNDYETVIPEIDEAVEKIHIEVFTENFQIDGEFTNLSELITWLKNDVFGISD